MARTRSPNRDEAKKAWLESGGKISTKDLAAAAEVPEQRIRKWKSEDKWQEALDTKQRGGQRGNRNAAGHGAPVGNANAVTHGAYATIHLEDLTPEEQAYIESITLDSETAMLRELQLLIAKERDLARKIKDYERAPTDELYVDRVVEMYVPHEKERYESNRQKLEGLQVERDNAAWELNAREAPTKAAVAKLEKLDADIEALHDKVAAEEHKFEGMGKLKHKMKTVMKSSPFERVLKLEVEYNKTHGRILKLIDSIRARESDGKRLDLDERKHTLAKQRLSGEYNIDLVTGEIIDTESAEDIDVDF